MTADEIREMPDASMNQSLASEATVYMVRDCFWMLREIAAQLAELNERLKKPIFVDIAR